MQELTIHIGLPKTATTTLQTHVFPALPEYAGKFSRGDRRRQTDAQRPGPPTPGARLLRDPDWAEDARVWVDWATQLGRPKVLVSEECLSAWPSRGGSAWPFTDHWSAEARERPHPVVGFFREIDALTAEDVQLRVILTLRNQTELIGSLYAQLQAHIRSPSQEDLEAKLDQLLRTDDPFFDYAALVEELQEVLGAENCLLLLHEDGLERNLARIAAFLGAPAGFPVAPGAAENVKNRGARTWEGATVERPLTKRGVFRAARSAADRWWPRSSRGSEAHLKRIIVRLDAAVTRLVRPQVRQGVVVEVSERREQDIRRHFAASNARLAARLGRDLARLGY